MHRRITPDTTLENLKNEAKRRLKAIRANDVNARARLERAFPKAPARPVLRDVQHVLALEYGFSGWKELKEAVDAFPRGVTGATASTAALKFEQLAQDMVVAYDSGDAACLRRIGDHYTMPMSADDLRAIVWRLIYKVRQAGGAASAFQLPEAQELISRSSGYPNWTALLESAKAGSPPPGKAHRIDSRKSRISLCRIPTARDWDDIIAVMREHRIESLDANGLMSDSALESLCKLEFVTSLGLGGTRALSDEGLQQLAYMPQLQHLNLSEYPGGKLTDRGLEVLRQLPNLRRFEMTWQKGITDAGVSNLRFCDRLEQVNLMGSPTGDGAIEALRGKPLLHNFSSGRLVTDAGLRLLRDFPMFRSRSGSRADFSDEWAPENATCLLIDGPFTDAGLANIAALEGLEGLDLFWHVTGITSNGFACMANLPRLASLGCDGKLSDDGAMAHIAAIPRLRRLRAQESVATDSGFAALSRSKSLEEIWGRECPNFTSRGFLALSRMPALRCLGIGCRKVDDEALAALPRFPALRELTSIGVTDEGFRHIGRCERLERLSCMYCRDTTDVATGHIAGLALKHYYAGLTKITDRSLELLGRMASLETVELYETKGVTDAGIACLADLPRLREVSLSGLPNVTLAGTAVFPACVHVHYDV